MSTHISRACQLPGRVLARIGTERVFLEAYWQINVVKQTSDRMKNTSNTCITWVKTTLLVFLLLRNPLNVFSNSFQS